jgi:glutathione synthase/RimK-type ligase-like ATP-grasp enzyme
MKVHINTTQRTQKFLELPEYPVKVYLNFGKAKRKMIKPRIIINSVHGLRNTRDKLVQHRLLQEAGIRKPRYFETHVEAIAYMEESGNAVVAKRINHSKCKGMYRFNTVEELNNSADRRVFDSQYYYFEEFVVCNREWRIHVSSAQDEEVISYRKCLRGEVLEEGEKPWFRNNDNCYFKLNSEEDKKENWGEVVAECKRAIEILGMDIAAVDVGEYTKKGARQFYIFEVNSAPGMEENTRKAYEKAIDTIVQSKL